MIKISKYSTLRKIIQKFKEGYFDLLIIISRGGLGKTFQAEDILLDDDVCEIKAHITPLGLFQYGYMYKDKKMWFDDVEALFNNDKMIGLMKQFAQTQPVKHIHYLTSKSVSVKEWDEKIPKKYKTKCKVLMTCNNLKRIKDLSVLALLDRGIQVYFVPPPEEIIQYIRDNFEDVDEEIIDNLKRKRKFSIRDYIKTYQLKKAGFKVTEF